MDPYKILGVTHDASLDEIKLAYRQRCRECHPDMGGDKVDFAKLAEAYEILSNPKLRQQYDAGELDIDLKAGRPRSVEHLLLALDAFALDPQGEFIVKAKRKIAVERSELAKKYADIVLGIELLGRRLKALREQNEPGEPESGFHLVEDFLTGMIRQGKVTLDQVAAELKSMKEAIDLLDGVRCELPRLADWQLR